MADEVREDLEHEEDGADEMEVLELEAEDGDIEEFVVIDRLDIGEHTFALVALLEDIRNMETMSEEEYREYYGEDSVFFLMKQDGETYEELSKEEFESIRAELEKELEERGHTI